ncbi:hypothetical protein L596_016177 [Steinernema carpocapsae]|uniref:Tyrosine-protein kinase n=1 Tax=Steinernema carpocapsae TaxID=34508 RepID=A0A4U5NHT9_STECR|nr:hypothetical protein L596_016177 [Steinernema carpocapsae]
MESKPQPKKGRLEQQEWYLGMLNRVDVEPYLKKEGDFVVRASETNGPVELVLSVLSNMRCMHFTLMWNTDKKRWGLACDKQKQFESVADLVDHYRQNDIPIGGIRLRNPVKRPRWFLKHEHLSYDPVSDKLGSGNFCDVYKGKLHKRRVVAIKLCHAAAVEKDTQAQECSLQRHKKASDALIQEANIMAEIQHVNIIKFFGICLDRPPVMVVMELCPGGSLLDHLHTYKDQISAGERVRYCLETSEGMCYLQEKGCIHRDLAARNCLISKYGVIKIADFGLSKIVSEIKGNSEGYQLQIPVRWMAPETLVAKPQFSTKSDAWAFGMLVWEIYTNGIKPWENWENKRIATHIRRGQMLEFPERTALEVKELVKQCWTSDPIKRCDFKYIAKRLAEIQNIYPAPRPMDSTIALLPNINPLSIDEINVLQETSEDIALEVVKSTMLKMNLDVGEKESLRQALRNERDPTIEDIVTNLKNHAAVTKKHEERAKEKAEKQQEKHVVKSGTVRKCNKRMPGNRVCSDQIDSKTSEDNDMNTCDQDGGTLRRKSGAQMKKKSRTNKDERNRRKGGPWVQRDATQSKEAPGGSNDKASNH